MTPRGPYEMRRGTPAPGRISTRFLSLSDREGKVVVVVHSLLRCFDRRIVRGAELNRLNCSHEPRVPKLVLGEYAHGSRQGCSADGVVASVEVV